MNAIELAENLDAEWKNDSLNYDTALDAAAMLRRQHNELTLMHEAIVELREAIEESQSLAMWAYTGCGIRNKLEKALKDTAQFDYLNQPAYTEDLK